jgi:hypothetical protein
VAERLCAHPGCERPLLAKSYCTVHYDRAKRGADMDAPVRRYDRQGIACLTNGCGRKPQARGMCISCYHAAKYRGEIGEVLCAAAGCGRVARTAGYCGMHYARRSTGRPLDAPVRHRHGEGRFDIHGYIRVVRADGTTVAAHRLVMEGILGRPLQPWENVHHINGLRTDNRPQNLELWAKPQPNGQRVEDLVRWIVEEYRDEVARLLAEEVV